MELAMLDKEHEENEKAKQKLPVSRPSWQQSVSGHCFADAAQLDQV